MIKKPLLIVAGEPYSVFSELFLKIYIKKIKKINIPIILIVSKDLFQKQMKKLNYSYRIRNIKINDILKKKIDNKKINILDIKFKFNKAFDKITDRSNNYIKKSFDVALDLLKNKKAIGMINGPISKKNFLKKKFLGITEYLSKRTKSKNHEVMLIYNSKLSVSPITTHLPLKKVSKNINKKKIINNVKLINNFYGKILKKKPSIAVLGLNPHCETNDRFSEENKFIKPAIQYLKNIKINIHGPFPADTIFLKQNTKKFNLIIGMYHDQVLTPIKTMYEFDAVNITIGLPFLRISPDHGPNNQMIGKKVSNPESLYNSINFFKKFNES